ncbi:unnamed protein product [Phytophthora fragariaefolia]|uniref:Unnamed protein product n=1 Tax=Phytophthora fragariaefolia TaxID=1490495 RepID=A0A9W6XD98_9STRA|nr:unnamed protein product [Phytophthora fragariaefolia]
MASSRPPTGTPLPASPEASDSDISLGEDGLPAMDEDVARFLGLKVRPKRPRSPSLSADPTQPTAPSLPTTPAPVDPVEESAASAPAAPEESAASVPAASEELDVSSPTVEVVDVPMFPSELLDAADDDEIRQARRRLRRGDETSDWHPELPAAAARHRSSNQRNHYDASALFDPGCKYALLRLLDVHGEAPHRCYLVQWKGRPLQLSWVWMEQLEEHKVMMEQVDQWKESGENEPFMAYFKRHFAGDTASESGLCFMDALRAACFHLGQPGLVTVEMWDAFEKVHTRALTYGVKRQDVTAFFQFLQHSNVPLDYEQLRVNLLEGSVPKIARLEQFSRTLPLGTYLVSAGEDIIGHCFVVVVRIPNPDDPADPGPVAALDGYKEDVDPPVALEPLSNLGWVEYVRWMARVEFLSSFQCRYGKRKSKSQKKREKRLKQQ